MADQKQIKIIKRGVDIWNAWRMDNPSIIPDLTEADLRGLKLQKIDFRQAILKSAKLQFSNFYGANFEKACLEKAKLQEAIFAQANLKGAKITGANMLESNLQNADMENSDLQRAQFNEDTVFSRVNLQGANLKDATGIGVGQIRESIINDKTILPDYLDDEMEGDDFLMQL